MKNNIIILVSIFFQTLVFTQDIQANDLKMVTLTQIGQGKTKDEAKYSALRNAIEKAFGTFISSNTSILNDEMVKDEIVSVSTGNIQSFEIISETQMTDGSFTSVVNATVSIGKLTTFCENKGIAVEFKGGIFAANIKLQELNRKNEEAVMTNLFLVLKKISSNCFDYSIEVGEPKQNQNNGQLWSVNSWVNAKSNNNISQLKEILQSTLENVKIQTSDLESYKNSKIRVYPINLKNIGTYYFRSLNSIFYVQTILGRIIPLNSINFEISDGLNKATGLNVIDSYNYSSSNNFISRNNSIQGLQRPNGWKSKYVNDNDCGSFYECIGAKYKVLENEYEAANFIHLLRSVKISTIKDRYSLSNINIKSINQRDYNFYYYNGAKYYDEGSPDVVVESSFYNLWNPSITIDYAQLNPGKIEFLFSILHNYTLDELSNIAGFKVQPIIVND